MVSLETKEKIALGVFIFSVLAVMFVGFFLTQDLIQNSTKIAGGAIQNTQEVKEQASLCTAKEDYCSGKTLIKEYCEDNEKKYQEIECEFDCDGGVCVNFATQYTYRGSGGSGGSKKTNIASTSGNIYDIGELTSEQTLEVLKQDIIILSISGTEYSVEVQDVTATHATLSISNSQITIEVGEDAQLDLNNDGDFEVYVRVRSTNAITKKVKLTFDLA
jgi:hypothetical protein